MALAQQGGYRLLAGQALTAPAAVQLRRDRRAPVLDLVEQAVAVHAETGHRLGAYAPAGGRRVGRRRAAEEHRACALGLFHAAGARWP